MENITLDEFNARLPPPWLGKVVARLHNTRSLLGRKVSRLDNDPSVTQIHNVAVFGERTVAQLSEALSEAARVIYVLTNSRSLSLTTNLRSLIAKGSITRSDIVVRALNMRRADVLGQLLPEVAVLRPDKEARFPGMPFIVFLVNVGDSDALYQAFLPCASAHLQA